MATIPKIFISYSHDSASHKDWVYSLACQLVENGVDVTLDQWDLQLGSNLMQFMEKSLANSDRVLVICTENYNKKSNEGLGGVGYEKNILTAELLANQNSAKFIPCIRSVTSKIKTPICLGSQTYIDFSDNNNFEESFKLLLHELFGILVKPKPLLGKTPLLPEKKLSFPLRNENSTIFFSHQKIMSSMKKLVIIALVIFAAGYITLMVQYF